MSETPQADEEIKHRRYERIVGTVTLIATLCAAGFAGGAYLQAKRQANIAQAALIESDHPFLEFNATSNADFSRGGKAYRSVTVTITNQGSRTAALQYAEFAIVNGDTEAAALDAVSKRGLVTLGLNCAGQIIRKTLPAAGSIRTECRSVVPRDNKVTQRLVGVMAYGGQLGTRWKQTVDMFEIGNGEWSDARPTFDLETRTDGSGHPIPTEKYH